MELRQIGRIESCFGGKFGAPRQPGLCPSAWGRLVLEREFRSAESLRGIEGFSHLWVVFGFHETAGRGWHPTVRPPRLGGNERVGVFASRSTFRPNPLGLSLVRLEGVDCQGADAPALLLGGIDMIDGTPVYDIKPYLPYAEAPPDARGGYAAEAPRRLEVRISDGCRAAYDALPPRAANLIAEALALDPRPAAGAGDPQRVHGAEFCGKNVRFSVDVGVCTVVEIADGGREINAAGE
jgi:tRNA-Thr(GGU) m(6)t(6)A37 methyltransferase TsaA